MVAFLVIFIVYALTFYANQRMASSARVTAQQAGILQALMVWHIGISFFFHAYIQRFGGDSIVYWNLNGPLAAVDAEGWWDYFGIGYPFMYWLNYIPSKLWHWDILAGHLIYGWLGYWAMRMLFLQLISLGRSSWRFLDTPWYAFLLFLPNLHFWTAGIGKEALCLLALACVFRGLQRPQFLYLAFGIGLIFMVRTYLAWLVLLALGLSLLPLWRQHRWARVYAASCLVLAISAFPLLFWYLGLGEISLASAQEIIARQFAMLGGQGVGSAVDMASYSQPMRLLTFWFRPLFLDAHNFTAYLASAENLLLVLLYMILPFTISWTQWKKAPISYGFGLILFLLISLLYANILSNLGIMMRMKSLFILFPIFWGGFLMGGLKEKL